MRRISLLLTVLLATSAFAVAPQFWRVRAAEDFLAGDIEGFAVTSRGEMKPAPALKKIATFTDPFVLAQATAPNGDRFFGTGNDGKVYRLRGSDLKLLYTAPEPELYAAAFHDGALYVGSSPNGKVYRVSPEDGKATVFYDPKQAYIWALQFLPNGDLAVGTGVDGKLFVVNAKGEGKLLFDAPETHLRSIAVRKDGSLLAGGSSKGRIYAVQTSGAAHALYDSALNEISSIYVDPNGIGWATGVSNVLPSSAPAQKQQGGAKSGQGTQQQGSSGSTEKKDSDQATPNVEVSFSFDDSSTSTASAAAGSSELYRIDTDDFVEVERKFDREMVYAVNAGPNGSILLSTGPSGRVYQYKSGEISLIATVPEKQVVTISNEGGATLITTTNSGAVYRMEERPATTAEFRSAAKDLERFSRFGHYRIEGNGIGNGALAIAFRSGNTRTPDATWSAWSTPQTASEGSVAAPSGRYLQWKLTMPKPASDTIIDAVSVGYMNRNVAPSIDAVAVQDPAVIFVSSAYPSSPQVVEATNPDENGIFSSLDNPRDRTPAEQGKKLYRKGFRTISWRAHDDNGDTLRYTLAFRAKGTEKWLRLRDNVDEMQYNFDTSQLPDGRYELRLVASDAIENPDAPLTDTREGIEFQVDNTPPTITSTSDANSVTIRVTDKGSPVGRVEYSADAQKWIRMTPADGIADSSDETYKLDRSAITGKFVIVRAVDGFYNVATESVRVP